MLYKKSHSVFIVIPVILALLLAGCGGGKPASAGGSPTVQASASAAAAGSPTPSPVPTPTPTEAPKGTLIGGWVTGIPDYVPPFRYGSIDQTRSKLTEGSISTVFDLRVSGVQREDVDAYYATLGKAGYKVSAGEIGNTYTLIATLELGYGDVTIVVTFNTENGDVQYALEAPV